MEIINNNQYKIYHLPKRYESINYVFDKCPELRKILLKSLDYITKNELKIITDKHKYMFFLTEKKLTALRKKSTLAVSNRYMNYLCAMGFFEKHYQHYDADGEADKMYLNIPNYKFLIAAEDELNQTKPMNMYVIRDFDLEKIEENTKRLLDKNIRPTNISKDILLVNGFNDMAKKIYFNTKKGLHNKKIIFENILLKINESIENKGYCYKADIYDLDFAKNDIDRALTTYQQVFSDIYSYKKPNQKEIAQYNLLDKKWIITKKEKENENATKD